MTKKELITLGQQLELERERKNRKYAIVSEEKIMSDLEYTLSQETVLNEVKTDIVVSEIENTLEKVVRLVVEMGGNFEEIRLLCDAGIVCELEWLNQICDEKGMVKEPRSGNLISGHVLENVIPVSFSLDLGKVLFDKDVSKSRKMEEKVLEQFPPIMGLVNPNVLFDKLSKLGYMEESTFCFSQYLQSWPNEVSNIFDIFINFGDQKKKGTEGKVKDRKKVDH